MTSSRRHWGLLAAAGAGTVAAAALLLLRATLGAGNWTLRYIADHTSPAVLVEPLVAALFLVAVTLLGITVAKRAWRRRVALVGLVAIGFLFGLYLGMAGPKGVVEPAYRAIFTAGMGSYLVEADHIGPFPGGRIPEGGAVAPGPGAYLRDFHRYVAGHPLDVSAFRVAVHPPGTTLLVYAVDRVWRFSPARREAAAHFLRRLDWAHLDTFLPPDPRRTLTALSMFVLGAFMTALTALVVYAFALDLGGDRSAAFGAAALWLTVPSTLLHVPALDQLTPMLALLISLCWYRACARRSRFWAVLAGVTIWVGLFFTLAMAVVVFALALATVLAAWRCPSARRRWLLPACAVGAAIVLSVVAWLVLDYNVVLVLYQCARRNAEWNATVGARSYGAWLAWNPVMFALFLGPAATALWLRGTGTALHRAVRLRHAKGGAVPMVEWAPAAAFAATMIVLWLSGQNRGEVERLWSFLMALALVAGAAALARRAPLARRTWLALIALQLVVVFVLRYRVDVQNVLDNVGDDLEVLMRTGAAPP